MGRVNVLRTAASGLLGPLLQQSQATSSHSFPRRWLSDARRRHDPLKILFCGADEFSGHSLRALQDLKLQKSDTVASIDVVCRPDKRRGRGLKTVHAVPVKGLATKLGLPLHQIDTFTGWSPPAGINLIIAVSFGLLVPPRVLNAATYGGLNVHPSLLPDLRGPAPIQYAILHGRSHTGVTLQTMHPSKFDHGIIIDQTPKPGIELPQDADTSSLVDVLGPAGAEMLRNNILEGNFISPKQAVDTSSIDESSLVHAPKLTTEDAHIDWTKWPAFKILRGSRVFQLWDESTYRACTGKDPLRVKFDGPWRVLDQRAISSEDFAYSRTGLPFACRVQGEKGWQFAIETADGEVLSPASASIESKEPGKGLQVLLQALQKARQNSRI